MRCHALLCSLLLFACTAFAQTATTPNVLRRQDVISVTGASVKIPNDVGALFPTFGEKVAGAPSTVSILIQGCAGGDTAGDNCATLETNTVTTARQIRTPSTAGVVYDYFLVTASWTSGTSPAVTIWSTLAPSH